MIEAAGRHRRAKWSALLALVTIPSCLLVAAFWLGRWHALRPLRAEAHTWLGTSLGSQLDAAGKAALLPAYGDNDLQPDDLDGFCWVPKLVPTPFVGVAPLPGRHLGAEVNRLQFRDVRELRVPKPDGVFRIFLIGGSTAFGVGASSNEATIGARLQARLRAGRLADKLGEIEVFTFATPAWTSTHERIAVENLLADLQPNVVVSLSGNNDVYWSVPGTNVLWGATGYDANLHGAVAAILRGAAGHDLPAHLAPDGAMTAPEVVADRLARNVDLLEQALRDSGAVYVFALQPTLAAVDKLPTARERAWLERIPERERRNFRDCYREIAARLAPRMADRFVDLAGSLNALHDREAFLDLFHFGDLGNDLIATAIAARLEAVLATRPRPGLPTPR